MGLRERIFSNVVVGLGLAAMSAMPAAAQSPGLALVVDRVGTVSIADAGAARPLATLAVLPAGTRLQLEPASSLTLLYVASGDEYTVSGPGGAQVDAAGISTTQGAVARRRAPGAARPVQLRGDALAMGGVVMRSGGLRARQPAGMLTAPPERFAWEAFARSDRYVVELRDAAGTVVFEGRVQGLALPFPASLALRPQERYTWTVAVSGDSALALTSGANFTVASDDVRDEARRVRPTDGAAFSDRLVYALWLEQVGAVGEARQMWQSLAEQRPDDDALTARARR
jgi:hypothetical protein